MDKDGEVTGAALNASCLEKTVRPAAEEIDNLCPSIINRVLNIAFAPAPCLFAQL